MATEIIMPKVDMVMDTGTFVEWLKQEGEWVEKGEPLFVILTDKANIEVEAPASGVLAGVTAQPDDVIPVTEVIGYIVARNEETPKARAGWAAEPVASSPQASEVEQKQAPASEPEAITPGLSAGGGKVRATPAARAAASELGLELAEIDGRGPRGRVHKADVLAYAERQAPAGRPRVPALPSTLPVLEIPLPEARIREKVLLKGPRAIIAGRMAYSAAAAPHITETLSVDMSETARLRDRVGPVIEARTGHSLSYTAILALAAARALTAHPYLNSSLDGEKILLWEDVHLGIAMSIQESLIVPVIRQAQERNLTGMAMELSRLVQAARNRRLEPADMSGSTFTITNLGMFGIESFTAIINPPESAILAVGRIVDTPVVVEGHVTGRPMMKLTLSADHRVIDGAAAAGFLSELKETLENPYLLI